MTLSVLVRLLRPMDPVVTSMCMPPATALRSLPVEVEPVLDETPTASTAQYFATAPYPPTSYPRARCTKKYQTCIPIGPVRHVGLFRRNRDGCPELVR